MLVDLLESESTVCKELKMGYEIVLRIPPGNNAGAIGKNA